MEEKEFTLSELISFGNYLLSESRTVTTEKDRVWDAGISNWKERQEEESV